MTVDSEAIFALMELRRHDPRALGELRGAMAAAWLDEREPRDAVPRARRRAAAVARADGRPSSSSPRRAARSRSSRPPSRSASSSARCARDASCASSAAGSSAQRRFRPDRSYRETDVLPPVRAPHEAVSCLERLAAHHVDRRSSSRLAPSVPSGSTLDALVAKPLADEVLERRPGAPRDVEQPVDLPLGEERRVVPPRLRPVGHLRQAGRDARASSAPCSIARSSRSSPCRTSKPASRSAFAERSERVRVQRRRRERAPPGGEVARRRRPAELRRRAAGAARGAPRA